MNDVTNLTTGLESTKVQADALSKLVSNYNSQFAEFQKKLDERNTEFSQGSVQLSELLTQLEMLTKEADKIIGEAKTALKWGTAQGLSDSFAAEAQKLLVPSILATTLAYLSIILFGVWTFIVMFIPTYLQLNLPRLEVPENLSVSSAIIYFLLSFGSRAALLAPALILVLYALRRQRQITSAREQFIFKKTVAAAIPGFKEQAAEEGANDHVRAMTSAAFECLLFNPLEQATYDLAANRKSGILSRWLVRIVQEAIQRARP